MGEYLQVTDCFYARLILILNYGGRVWGAKSDVVKS